MNDEQWKMKSPTAAIDPGTTSAAIVEPAAAAAIDPAAAAIDPRAAAVDPAAAAIDPAATTIHPGSPAIGPSSATAIDPGAAAIDPTSLCLCTRYQSSQDNSADDSLRPFLQALKEIPSADQLDLLNLLLHDRTSYSVFGFQFSVVSPQLQSLLDETES
jgi:hypothetical protein